jgi:hypothetical protein
MYYKFEHLKHIKITTELRHSDIESIIVKGIIYKKEIKDPESQYSNCIYYLQQLPAPIGIQYDSKNQKLEFDKVEKAITEMKSNFYARDGYLSLARLKFKIACFERFYPNDFYRHDIENLASCYKINSDVSNEIYYWDEAISRDKNRSDKYEWKKEFIEAKDKSRLF